MISGSFFATAYKQTLLQLVQGHTFMMALYTNKANLDASTPAYIPQGEVTGYGYQPGGIVLTGARVTVDGTTAILSFNPPDWQNVAFFGARAAMIYDATLGNVMVSVHDFGLDIAANFQDFKIPLPNPTAAAGLVRI